MNYQTLKIENCYNIENLAKIDVAASKAIDYALQYVEYAVSSTTLDDDGICHLTFVTGQDADIAAVTTEFQRNFEEKFNEIIIEEYSK